MKKFILAVLALVAMLVMMPADQAHAAVAYPKVVVESYSISDGKVLNDSDVTLSIVLANKSEKVNVSDVLLTYTSTKNTITPVMGNSNQVYIASVNAGQEVTVDIPVHITDDGSGMAVADITLQYVITSFDINGVVSYNQQSNTSNIALKIDTEVEALNVSNFSFPSTGVLYEKGMVSCTYSNGSDETISNIVMHIDGLNDGEQTISLGNLAANKNGYFESYVVFDQVGSKTVSVFFTYESEDGTEYTTPTASVYTEVIERTVQQTPSTGDTTTGNTETVTPSSNGFNISYVLFGLAGLLVLISVIFAIRSSRKK